MKRIGIVYGTFHEEEAKVMLNEAREAAKEANLEILVEVPVPGSVEKPLAAKRLLEREDIDGVALLGIIEKGSTKHGFTMGQSLMHFTMELSLTFDKPVTLGVIGPGALEEHIPPRLKAYARKAIEAQSVML